MLAILAASGIAFVATAKQNHRFPIGKYCGQLLSNGVMVEAETTFAPSAADGRIRGSYIFLDAGQTVTGLLAEPGDDGDGNDLTHTLLWQDRYGHGNLVVTFTSDFSAFEGSWGAGEETLFPWNGTRCEQIVS